MDAEQMIRREILLLAMKNKDIKTAAITEANIEALYQDLVEKGAHWDYENEFRASGIETKLPCDYSRHYESKAVATHLSDGTWIGWTYWYGGGKHGEPEAVPWMEDAYFLDVTEKEKVVTMREFKKKEPAP